MEWTSDAFVSTRRKTLKLCLAVISGTLSLLNPGGVARAQQCGTSGGSAFSGESGDSGDVFGSSCGCPYGGDGGDGGDGFGGDGGGGGDGSACFYYGPPGMGEWSAPGCGT